MKLTLVLTGHYAGKTVRLNNHQFVDGECTLEGTAQQIEGAARYLERCYCAKQKDQISGVQHHNAAAAGSGNPEGLSGGELRPTGQVPNPNSLFSDGHDPLLPSDGGAGMGASGSGQEDSGLHPDKVAKIAKAIAGLDPKVDDHWTDAGLPSVEVISAAIADQNLTRKMIEVVAPNITREKVAEAADL